MGPILVFAAVNDVGGRIELVDTLVMVTILVSDTFGGVGVRIESGAPLVMGPILIYASVSSVGGRIGLGVPLVVGPILVSDAFGGVYGRNQSGAPVDMRA